jgi:hypothetical protein
MPPELKEFSALAAPSAGVNFRAHAPAIFVGERTTPSGKAVLLVLRFEGYVIYGDGPVTYTFNFDEYGRNVEMNQHVVTRQTVIPSAGNFDRLFTGQADPNDRAHISFRYVIKGRDGIIDAWLKEQSLEMKVRTGPATQAAP